MYFLLAEPSQDVFLLPKVPWRARGSILLVNKSMIILMPAIFDLMTVVRYDHTDLQLSIRVKNYPGIITELKRKVHIQLDIS